jgi:tRNA (cmo5U34)-methyltransferase
MEERRRRREQQHAARLICRYRGPMAQFHWDPDAYLEMVRAEVPDYDRVQDELARATEGVDAHRVLELGTGSGVTSRRVLARHPHARLTGVDSSEEMLAAADLPGADLRLQDLRDPLPEGPFDLVFSALAIHHLEAPQKADLIARVAAVLAPGGRFAMADVVVPEDPADVVTPLDPGFDLPETVPALLAWMGDAGLRARVSWQARDLAVLVGDAPVGSASAGQAATA